MTQVSPREGPALGPVDAALDHFARLGLERAYALDRVALDDAYLKRSRDVHPDRWVTGTPREQRLAMEHTSVLNEAHQTLRDPVRRAEYLLKLRGIDLDSTKAEGGAPKPDQAFLVEMLQRRETLENLSGDANGLEVWLEDVEDEREQALADAVGALSKNDVGRAAESLVRVRYLRRLLDEIESAVEGS